MINHFRKLAAVGLASTLFLCTEPGGTVFFVRSQADTLSSEESATVEYVTNSSDSSLWDDEVIEESDIGNTYEASKAVAEPVDDLRVQAAIQWALSIAADDTHGYSQIGRWGVDYDCSSFLIAAFHNGGFAIPTGYGNTGTMKSSFQAVGFSWISWSELGGTQGLRRGDVLLAPGHTELYIGDGQNVAAHNDYDGLTGDGNGKEIRVGSYYTFGGGWSGVLRYTGGAGAASSSSSKNASSTTGSGTGTASSTGNNSTTAGSGTSTGTGTGTTGTGTTGTSTSTKTGSTGTGNSSASTGTTGTGTSAKTGTSGTGNSSASTGTTGTSNSSASSATSTKSGTGTGNTAASASQTSGTGNSSASKSSTASNTGTAGSGTTKTAGSTGSAGGSTANTTAANTANTNTAATSTTTGSKNQAAASTASSASVQSYYSGQLRATYMISLRAGLKSFRVTSQVREEATGYQVSYSTSAKFKGAKKKTSKQAELTISGLKSQKLYYVRVRTYKKVNGKTQYSAWSVTKNITTW